MRILLALDGSESSVRARDLVAGLRWPKGTALCAMSAYELPIDWTGAVGAPVPWVADAEDAMRDELSAELERLEEPFAGRGWRLERRVVKGRPATAILDVARRFEADLIVLGSRGRGPLTTMLLGSVSAEVVDQADCSVLVARGSEASRVLVATDGSDVARAIPGLLSAWEAFSGAAVEAISIAPLPDRSFDLVAEVYTLGTYRSDDDRQSLLDRHRHLAEEMAQHLTERGIVATASVLAGDAAHEIIGAAHRRGADLIVTGTRGLHGVERVILGGVARNVLLHAPCSVLVVRSRSRAEGGAGAERTESTPRAPQTV
jgi:nucleotide-binding universal stress UspA family protein